MKTKKVTDHFGGIKEAAAALEIWPQTIYQWGGTVPMAIQYKIEVVTEGALKADRKKAK